MPIRTLVNPATTQQREVQGRGYRMRVPSFVIGDRVIWGMTERFLRQLLGLLDR